MQATSTSPFLAHLSPEALQANRTVRFWKLCSTRREM